MYFWNSYPFVRFSIFLILGILAFDSNPKLWEHGFVALAVGIVLFSISLLRSSTRGFYKLRHVNGIFALLIIFTIGGIICKTKYHSHPANHYKNINKKIIGFTGVVTRPATERTNHFRYDLLLESAILGSDSIVKTSGEIHLYIRKDSSIQRAYYGDKLAVYGSLYPIPGPDNPNEFDYQKYLKRQNILSHSFVRPNDVKIISSNPSNSFLAYAFSLRENASETIDKYILNSREKGIAKALLLGIKDHLDNDIKKAYSAAGAMHVLAVSGLHVGIIFLILQGVFGRLRKTGKIGKYAFACISILIIWLYASLTGLSPSVLRAATMFSFIAIGQIATREGNIYNTLSFSGFMLLLIDPYLIYSVGFQLSFAAVVGIVYIQSKLYRLFHFNWWILDKAWSITCVSIAAQLATFPLSAFYFHQFPTYFLISNLIVIPSSFLMLLSGISMIIIEPFFSSLSKILGQGLNQLIWFLNEIISYVHRFPNSLIEWIHLDQLGLVFTYAIVITMIVGFHYKSFKTLVFSSLLGFGFIVWTLITHQIQHERKELVFYELANTTAIDYIKGHASQLYIDNYEKEELELLSFQINPHRLASLLRPISETIVDSNFTRKDDLTLGSIGGKRFVLFDTTTYHLDFKKKIVSDFIIIENQAVKSLKWLKQNFVFDQIILSTKNSRFYSQKMKEQAKELDLRLHSIKEEGSLRITLDEGIKKERTILSALFTTNPD
ncbi:ComEC/Rec2 family competence protein [Ekhidna sp.]|uniref:ComEC/Rec2 family competence protein n=1 Tax=Ekhidna sp. TaxID=2608089 RepID=UPI003BAAE664